MKEWLLKPEEPPKITKPTIYTGSIPINKIKTPEEIAEE